MSFGLKITIIVVLKLVFIFWIKATYFSSPVDISAPKTTPAIHLFNLSTNNKEKKHD